MSSSLNAIFIEPYIQQLKSAAAGFYHLLEPILQILRPLGTGALEFSICFLRAALYYYVISRCLRLKHRKDLRRYCCLLSDFILITFCYYFINSPLTAIGIILPAEAVLACLFTRNTFAKKVVLGSALCLLSLPAQGVIWFCYRCVTGKENYFLQQSGIVKYSTILIYFMLLAALAFVMLNLRRRSPAFPVPVLLTFLLLTLAGVFTTQTLFLAATKLKQTDDRIVSLLRLAGYSSFTTLLLLFLFLLLTERVFRRSLAIRQAAEQQKRETEQYQLLKQANQVLQTWRHEYSTHLQAISHLQMHEQYEQCRQYISRLTESIQDTAAVVYTGNHTLDAILSIKLQAAREAGIHFTHELYLPSEPLLPLNQVQFSALLGNLLNNAIEAASDVEHAYIRLTIKTARSNMLIEVKNSCSGQYRYDSSHELITTKGEGRGIGLKRIMDIAEEAGGFCRLLPEPDCFTAFIVLPLTGHEEIRYDTA